VRCWAPGDLAAPSAVPATVEQIPIPAMTMMNHRIDTAWEVDMPQQDLGSSSEAYGIPRGARKDLWRKTLK